MWSNTQKNRPGSGLRTSTSRKAILVVVGLLVAIGLWKFSMRGTTYAREWYSSGEFVRHHMASTPQFEIQSACLGLSVVLLMADDEQMHP